MLIKDCMTKHVDLTSPSTTIAEAARKMRDGDYGMLPVGENDRLIGMITDRDLAIRAVAEGKDPNRATVKDIMSPRVLYCYEDDDTKEAARSMGKNQVRRLPVLNRKKRLVGILSLGDLATKTSGEEKNIHESLKSISQKGKKRASREAA